MAIRLQPQQEPLRPGLRQELPDPHIPWGISRRVFADLQLTTEGGLYKKARVLPTDPEGLFILRHFSHDRPTRWSIRQVYCIHSRDLTHAFEMKLRQTEKQATNSAFAPSWNTEPEADLRAIAIERWKRATSPFSPFQVMEPDGRRVQFDCVRVAPLWHGSDEGRCESIASTGFTFFGKKALAGSATGSTDVGFFGSGIYFTNSARYSADIYSAGHLLLSWVSAREPFPVVHDGTIPECKDMQLLKGSHAYKNYNAHYIPVVADPPDPDNAFYYPCKRGEKPLCDEWVVFDSSQALPRYWIELQADGPWMPAPASAPQAVAHLTPLLFHLLERDDIHLDLKMRKICATLLARLLPLEPEDDLDDSAIALAEDLSQLISAGRIDKGVRKRLVERFIPAASGGPASPAASPPPAAAPVAPSVVPAAVSTGVVVPTASSGPLPAYAFGKAQWTAYFGDVGIEPPLPSNIESILQGPCPIFSGKRVQDTHMLVLIPQTINGAPFTLNALNALVQAPRQGTPTKIDVGDSWDKALAEHGPKPSLASHWVLMTRQAVPNSTSKRYSDQCALVARLGSSYEVPHLLDAVTCVLLERIRTGAFLYGEDSWVRVQEQTEGYRLVFGAFAASGLRVCDFFGDFLASDSVGVSGLRKF